MCCYEKLAGAKIRLRGRGSGHSEGGRGEAPVPLMLAAPEQNQQVRRWRCWDSERRESIRHHSGAQVRASAILVERLPAN